MSIPMYLAMTATDFSVFSILPTHMAWMSAHFSVMDRGLSNLPAALPTGSILILDDQHPWDGHSISAVLRTLQDFLQRNTLLGILLDFERPACPQTLKLAEAITVLCLDHGCTAAMPEVFARHEAAAVFLPSRPHWSPKPPSLGREIWQEVSPAPSRVRISSGKVEKEVLSTLFFSRPEGRPIFTDLELLCQYYTQVRDKGIEVTLFDGPESLEQKLSLWEASGVRLAIGPYRYLVGKRAPSA